MRIVSLHLIRRDAALRLLGLYKQANAGHIGSSLSCLEILLDIFFNRLGQDDHFVLSKGHAAAALYTAMHAVGKLTEADLETFYKDGTFLAAHPPCGQAIPGIPFGTGSLGHGLSLGAGLALAARLKRQPTKVYCVLSDGECNEGSTWEAALFAAHHKLSHLTVVVDANGLQGIGRTSDVMATEPFVEKWQSFGFETVEVHDGHSFELLEQAHAGFKNPDAPKCIVARTIKGNGVSYMSDRMEWHYLPMNNLQYATALAEVENYFKERTGA